MEPKQDIGTAIKSKLDNLKASPDASVWYTIETKLKKKKRKRILLLWFFGSLFGISLLSLFFSLSLKTETTNKLLKKNVKQTQTNSTSYTKQTNNKKINPSVSNSIKQPAKLKTLSTNNSVKKINKPVEKYGNKIAEKDISNKSNLSKLITNNFNEQSQRNKKTSSNKEKINLLEKDSLEEITKVNNTKTSFLKDKDSSSTKKADTSRWSVTSQIIFSNYSAFNTPTSAISSVNYGFLASYKMSNSTYIRIGIRPLNLNQTVENNINMVKYLEFPIEVKYSPFNKKINPYFTTGLSYFTLQEATTNNINNDNYNTSASVNLGIGIETKLFEKLYFNVEPNFNYQLQPFAQDNTIKPFLFSVQTGLEYRF